MEQLVALVEKVAALISSQRFVTTIIGVIVIAALFQGAIADFFGVEPWQMPDEATLETQITGIVGHALTLLAAILSVLKLFAGLQQSISTDPPRLSRDWDIRYSQGTVKGFEPGTTDKA